MGWFEARDEQEYQEILNRLAADMILPPKAVRVRNPKGVSAEIAAQFRKSKILAARGDGLESGRVVKGYIVDDAEGLSADFAIQNGRLSVAAALDLRSARPALGQAALKAITLDKVHRSDDRAARYGVYAVPPSRRPEVKEHVSLLGDYSDDIFNWMERDDRNRFLRIFYDAFNSHGKLNSLS